MKRLSLKKVLSFVFICLFVFSICAVGIKGVQAEDEDPLVMLFNETNTYNIVADSIDLQDVSNLKSEQNSNGKYGTPQQHVSYDLTQKNSNQVANKSQITVLTHGYGANASTWTNIINGYYSGFAPTKESIIYKYWQKYKSDLVVVLGEFEKKNKDETVQFDDKYSKSYNFHLYDLTTQTNYAYTNNIFNEYNKNTEVQNLFDNFNENKHLLVLFNSCINCDSNDNVYFQFNYLLSRIAKQYKEKMNVLPKYNLIGHSRGGITNLQYALDHPDMVDNLISMGTPYNGSTTALLFGEKYTGDNKDALYDIVDSEVYSTYKMRWNNDYELYKNINAVAIGGYSSLSFFSNILHSDLTGQIPSKYLHLVDPAIAAIKVLKVVSDLSMGLAKAVITRFQIMALRQIFPESKIVALFNILINELFYDSSFVSFANDTLVNLSSQLATGFKGFVKETRKFTENENINFTKLAAYNVPVVHNLEPRDEKILNKVMSALGDYKNGISYEEKEDGTIKITRVSKELFDDTTNTSYTVPSSIDGKTVTEIGDNAYYGVFDYWSNIKTLEIPASINKIGENAFRENRSLTNINIRNQSTDVEIGEGAFAECIQLTSATLPSKLTKISDGMFSECKELTSITLPTTVTSIGGGAFSECTSLTSVNGIEQVTEIGNFAFYNCYYLSGITLNSGLNTLGDFAFAYCKNMTGTITIPNAITGINGTFIGCKKLTGINFGSGVTTLSEFAFSDCENLTSIYIPQNLTNIDAGAFYGCKGIESITVSASNNAYKVEGNCLMTKTGKVLLLACNNSVIPDDIKGIGDYACANCDEMVSFTGKTDLEYIGAGAFSGCSKLTNVVLYENLTEIKDDAFANCTSLVEIKLPDNVSKLGKSVFSGCTNLEKVTLSDNLIAIEEGTFENCTKLEEIVFGYNLVGIANKAFYGCQNLEKVIISTGNDMVYVGSKTFDGTSENLKIYVPAQSYEKYTSNVLWQAYADKLSTHDTSVTFNLNGGTMDETSTTLTYGAYVEELPQPAVIGRFFDGWYTSSDFNVESKVSIGMVWTSLVDGVTLYAKWSETPISAGDTFEIVYNNIESGVYSGEGNPLSYTETTDTIILKNPTRADGYRFMGWYLDENFNSSVIKQIIQGCTGDIVLYAKWAKVYTITFNKNNGEANETMTGIEGEVIQLPTPLKNGYHGTWDRWEVIDETYSTGNFGKGYMIGNSDVTLDALWEGNFYRINYHNPKVYDRYSTVYPTYKYRCGEVTALQNPINYHFDIFKGFFLDCKFETPITEIPADAVGIFDVYVKWDSFNCGTSRSTAVKITDSGKWKQHYDDIDIFIDKNSYPEGNEYKYIKFVIDLEIWEGDDGNQHLMLYDKYDSKNGKELWSMKVVHVPYKKVATHHIYHFQFYIPIDLSSGWTTNESGTMYYKYFYLLYTASGKYDDDWYNSNLSINAYLCVDAEDEVTSSPVIWNG